MRESSGTAGQPCGHLDKGPSRPGQLVDQVETWTQARIARGSWSTLRALGHVPESLGTAGRPRRPLNTSQSPPRELVVTTVHRTWDRFDQEGWWTPG